VAGIIPHFIGVADAVGKVPDRIDGSFLVVEFDAQRHANPFL